MQIILQEDYPSLGYIGDMVTVKPGFARNFLIPRGIGVEAASRNGRLLKHRVDGIRAKRMKKKAEAEVYAKKLEATTLAFVLKIGQAGKSFGAVTVRDLEASFRKEGIELNKKQIRLVEPIKGAGTYVVEVKVHAEVVAKVPVAVTAEVPVAAPKVMDDGEKKPKKGKGKKKADDASPDTEAVPTE